MVTFDKIKSERLQAITNIMKLLLTFLILIISQLVFCQSKKNEILLEKDKYGVAYITHETSRREYIWLIPSDPDDNIEAYNEYYQHIIADTNFTFRFRNNLYSSSRWTPIYIIDNKYYLYGPSDWMYNFGFIISDSTVFKDFSDGPGLFVILTSKKISDIEYQYTTIDYYKKQIKISIYIIDKTNEIAVWKFETEDQTEYELMINSNNIKSFPLLIRHCHKMKCITEYDFKQPDFEKLINNAR